MCGFTGFVNIKKKFPNILDSKNILKNMNNTLYKRGPDEDGYYVTENICLAHKRLIVIDPDGGKQPMIEYYSYGSYVICYNGQIYNTDEIKKILVANGFSFNGHCDTEVLLKGYIHFGNDIVKHLNGIFSFVIWNTKNNELFMARDHFRCKTFILFIN